MEEAIAARLDPCGMGPLKAVTCTFCFAGEFRRLYHIPPPPLLEGRPSFNTLKLCMPGNTIAANARRSSLFPLIW